MATFTRASAWNNSGTFDNQDLLWYAKGVAAMQARALDDPASWWFFAAIHGQLIQGDEFPDWSTIPAPPNVPTTPPPAPNVSKLFWDQCQHRTWYFLPWHRGYLLALEAQLRADIISLGGPSNWALPYWDYLGPDTQSQMPPAFSDPNLPDGNANPLLVAARFGPNGDGNIFVPVPPVSDKVMSNDVFTGDDKVTKPPGFGGPDTGFSHVGKLSGNIENNPHNLVHGFVGGTSQTSGLDGIMGYPETAALDPIFYMHHCNIDRMWAGWNQTNENTDEQNWLDGPTAAGDREFVMPMPGGTQWVYTPNDVKSLDQLNYAYDSLPQPAAPAPELLSRRLTRLGVSAAAAAGVAAGAANVNTNEKTELVGASEAALPITGTEASTTVRLQPAPTNRVNASLAAAAETAEPDRVYLNLENVRGTRDAFVLSVYINVPQGANPADHPELFAGSVGLFGLRSASRPDGDHAGEGLNFVLDISDIVDRLHLNNALTVESLGVRIVPHQSVPADAKITVGRISIYRKGR